MRRKARTLPLDRINLAGPDTLTGSAVASIWSKVLELDDHLVAGIDPGGFEKEPQGFYARLMAFESARDERALHQRRNDPKGR